MYTVRELCKLSKLSRGTLIYYDSLGILKPISRSATNYRLYSDESIECLEKICMYREAGVPLADIAKLMCMPRDEDNKTVDILEKTLHMLNDQAHRIKEKQRAVIRMIKLRRGGVDTAESEIRDNEKFYDELMEMMPLYAFDLDKYRGLNTDEQT